MKRINLFCKSFHYGWFALLLLLTLSDCVTPFDPEISKYEDLLVVDGAISNIPGSAYVNLSKTSSYSGRTKNPLNAASVTLIDELDNRILFNNSANGKYTPANRDFAGEIGRSYKIYIETAEGIICESPFEKIPEPIPLDAVNYEFISGDNDRDRGLEITVDVLNKNRTNAYFLWEYTETWQFEVPNVSSFVPDSRVCYKTAKPPVFLIGTTQNLVQKQLVKHPLYFINNSSNRLYIKYSVNVTQHTLTEPTYVFYHDLIEVNENQGGLFDASPITLIGNMRNLSDPDLPVLGNFQVSGAAAKRIFINHAVVAGKLIVPSGFENCQTQYAGELTGGGLLDSLAHAGWFVIDRTFNPAANDTIITLVNYRACCDCKMNGTNVKPEFWESE